jgi:hypothetical protein
MKLNSLNQGAPGCLKLALYHLFVIVLSCSFWYLFLGGKRGILVGIGAYISILSGMLFRRVFGRAQRG